MIGNHVVIDHGDDTFSLYAHVRRGSVTVSRGDVVVAGQHVADVGSTGNTSEPHLHLQLMDRADPTAATGLPWRWSDVTTEPGDLDRRWGNGSRGTGARAAMVPTDGVPPNGQIFTA